MSVTQTAQDSQVIPHPPTRTAIWLFTYLFWWHLPLLPDSWNPSTETWGTSSATSPIILATSRNVIFLLYSKPNFQNQALPHTWPQEVATSSIVALTSLVLMSLLLYITTWISFSFLLIRPQLWISQDTYFLQTQHPSSFPLNIYCWSAAIPYKTTLVNILGDFNIHVDNPSNSLASSLTLFPPKNLVLYTTSATHSHNYSLIINNSFKL